MSDVFTPAQEARIVGIVDARLSDLSAALYATHERTVALEGRLSGSIESVSNVLSLAIDNEISMILDDKEVVSDDA